MLLVARSVDKLEAIESIRASGGDALAIAANLADPGDVARMAATARSQAGVPDILINNAGAGRWLSVQRRARRRRAR